MNKNGKLYMRKVLFTSKLALVLTLCYMLFRIVLLPQQLEKSLLPAPVAGNDSMLQYKTMSSQNLSFADYTEIVKRNPFGVSGQTAAKSEGILTAGYIGLERSVSDELGLALLGTISGNPAVARAVIKDVKTDVLKLYKIGQAVAGARIEAIEKDKIILSYNGERRALKLNTMKPLSNGDDTYTSASGTINEIKDITKTDLSSEETNPGPLTRAERVDTILRKAVIEPYITNGQIEGLRINGLENIGIAKNFGLKNGDVIRTIDGQCLTSKQKAFQVLKKARSQPSMSVELLRGNETKEFSFSTK